MDINTTTARPTIAGLFEARHNRIEDFRIEHGCNPPEFPFWACPEHYTRRPFAPLWVAGDGNTVVEWSSGWTWGQSHNQQAWRDPVELIETCYLAHEPALFSLYVVLMDGRQVLRLTGSFVGHSAGYSMFTTDSALAARIVTVANRALPHQVRFMTRYGFDWAHARHRFPLAAEAESLAGFVRDGKLRSMVFVEECDAPTVFPGVEESGGSLTETP